MEHSRNNNPLISLLSREERFIQTAFRSFIITKQPENVPQGIDWGRIAQIAHVNNLGHVLHFLYHDNRLPLRQMDHWGRLRMQLLFNNTLKLRLAVRLFRLFDAAGVRSVGLRGLTLAHIYYPEPGLRPMKDLDILVGAKDHNDVVKIMQSGGFAPSKILRSQVVYEIEGTEIEIHLSLLTAKRYSAVFDRDALLDSRIKTATAEGDIYKLPAEQELIELVAHAFVHHELQGFGRMLDIALVMNRPDINWNIVARWAEEARLVNMFLFTLSFTDRLFDLGLSTELHFGKPLPSWFPKMYNSYIRLYFGGDTPYHYIRRIKNMMYVAERPKTKLNQFWRIFSAKYLKDMIYLLHKDKAPDIAA